MWKSQETFEKYAYLLPRFRLVRAVFLFPAYLEKNGNKMQRSLENRYRDLITSTVEETQDTTELQTPVEEKNHQKETKKKK